MYFYCSPTFIELLKVEINLELKYATSVEL